VVPGRDEADELTRWARERAPTLIERAEAEAVAVLRDALVAAATPSGQTPPAPHSTVERPVRETVPQRHTEPGQSRPDEPGELAWAYCVLRADDAWPSDLQGVAPDGAVHAVRNGDLIALVSPVPRAEFAAEPLRRNLNDMGWLEQVARAHERVLDQTLQLSTIVPLSMCTLYEGPERVREVLVREHDAFAEALKALEGRWEWAVKVLVDGDRLLAAVGRDADTGETSTVERHPSGEGGAYMARRRRERQNREAANALAAQIAEHVHARLQDWALDAVTRPAQNPQLSGHHGRMVLNAAYLVERERTAALRELVADLEQRHADLGAQIEITGPWPPYNFVSADGAAAIT
jgi:hypothetical protein